MADPNAVALTSIQGKNVLDFLQGYLTCDLERVSNGSAIPMALTELKGRVIANGWVYGQQDRATLITHSTLAADVKQHLMPFMRFSRCEFLGQTEIAFLTSRAKTESDSVRLEPFDAYLTLDSTHALDLNEFQVANSYVLVIKKTSRMFLPQMLNLVVFGAVSFEKGCYLGQEVVARAQHRGKVKRQLAKIDLANCVMPIGSPMETEAGRRAIIVAKAGSQALVVGPNLGSNSQAQPVTV